MRTKTLLYKSWKELLGFAVICFVCPWVVQSAPLAISLFCVIVFFFFILKDATWLLLIPALYFLLPQHIADSVGSFGNLSILVKYQYIVLYILIFMAFSLAGINKKRISINSKTQYCSILLFLIGLFYYHIFNNIADIYNITSFIVLYLFYYVVASNKKISIDLYLLGLDIMFYALSSFAIIEYFWHISPYDNLFYADASYNYYDYTDYLRVKCLTGHPLIFVGFLAMYQISLYTRLLYKKNKWVYLNIIIFFFVSLLTMSRTIFVIELVLLILYLYLITTGFSQKKNSAIFLIVFVTVLLLCFLDEIQYISERFNDSHGSETNRMAAYKVALKMFCNEPLGIGENFLKFYRHYRSDMPRDFIVPVLDNAFLSILVQFGVFVFIYLEVLLFPIFDTKRNISKYGNYGYARILFILSIVTFLLMSFSYAVTKYFGIMMMFISSLVIIHKLSQKKNYLYGRINYNSKL